MKDATVAAKQYFGTDDKMTDYLGAIFLDPSRVVETREKLSFIPIDITDLFEAWLRRVGQVVHRTGSVPASEVGLGFADEVRCAIYPCRCFYTHEYGS
jgi:hypothetical protein